MRTTSQTHKMLKEPQDYVALEEQKEPLISGKTHHEVAMNLVNTAYMVLLCCITLVSFGTFVYWLVTTEPYASYAKTFFDEHPNIDYLSRAINCIMLCAEVHYFPQERRIRFHRERGSIAMIAAIVFGTMLISAGIAWPMILWRSEETQMDDWGWFLITAISITMICIYIIGHTCIELPDKD